MGGETEAYYAAQKRTTYCEPAWRIRLRCTSIYLLANPASIAMEFKRNPFRYAADFSLDDIVGRSDEIAHVESVIRDGRRLFLSGPRGFGKTSILRAAQANLSRSGAIVLYVNAETSPDVGKLIGEIVAGAAAQLHNDAEDGIEQACRFFSRLKPTLRFSADGQEMSVSIGIDLSAGKYRQMEALARTLDSLDRFAHTLPGLVRLRSSSKSSRH